MRSFLSVLAVLALAAPARATNTEGQTSGNGYVSQPGTLGSNNDTVTMQVQGMATVGLLLTDTWAATVAAQVSVNGVTWVGVDMFNLDTDAQVASTTANGSFLIPVLGVQKVRVIMTPYTSGTAIATLRGTNAPARYMVTALASGSNVDVAVIGTAATVDTALTGQTADADVEAATANMRLVSWTARESAAGAAAATVIFRHGVLSGGNCTAGGVIAYVELAPNESVGHSYDARGLAAASGVCIDVVAGTVDVGISTVVEGAP